MWTRRMKESASVFVFFFMFSSFLVVFLVFFHIINERGATLIPTLTWGAWYIWIPSEYMCYSSFLFSNLSIYSLRYDLGGIFLMSSDVVVTGSSHIQQSWHNGCQNIAVTRCSERTPVFVFACLSPCEVDPDYTTHGLLSPSHLSPIDGKPSETMTTHYSETTSYLRDFTPVRLRHICLCSLTTSPCWVERPHCETFIEVYFPKMGSLMS